MENSAYRYLHKWTNDRIPIVFYTLPMIHIGDKSYYDKINKLLDEFNHVLVEGVSLGPKYKEIGRYELLSEKLGLSNQWNELRIPDDIKVVNIDINSNELGRKIKKLHNKEKKLLKTYEKLVKKLDTGDNLKEEIKKLLKYPENINYKLIDPANHYFFEHRKKKSLDLIIENDRDYIFQYNIEKYIKENRTREYRLDTGIIVGDNHMPAIYRELEKNGYKWELLDKIIVI